jgi:hypothetical protein
MVVVTKHPVRPTSNIDIFEKIREFVTQDNTRHGAAAKFTMSLVGFLEKLDLHG